MAVHHHHDADTKGLESLAPGHVGSTLLLQSESVKNVVQGSTLGTILKLSELCPSTLGAIIDPLTLRHSEAARVEVAP